MIQIINEFLDKVMKTDFEGEQVVMNHFPYGCCKVASIFFAAYLAKNNIVDKKDIMVIANADNGKSSHAWIEINNKIIDITIDQFPNINKDEYIFELDSEFHQHFYGAGKYSFDEIMKFHKHYEADFKKNYEKLIRA